MSNTKLTPEQNALIQRIQENSGYIDFNNLTADERETAETLKMRGLLIPNLGKRGQSHRRSALHTLALAR